MLWPAISVDTVAITAPMIVAACLQGVFLPVMLLLFRKHYALLVQRSDGVDVLMSPKSKFNPSCHPGTAWTRAFLVATGGESAIATSGPAGKELSTSVAKHEAIAALQVPCWWRWRGRC